MKESSDRFYYVLASDGDWQTITHLLWFFGGLISFVGFQILPWFKFDEDAEWWYNGGQMIAEGVGWVQGIVILYLLLAALIALGQAKVVPMPVALPGVLTIIIVLATLVVVSIAAADALEEVRTLARPVWHIGLGVMIVGHAAMIWGTIYGLVSQTVSKFDILRREY